jgi:cystathionine beta-lyase/cystathionine gamma-synthase
MLGFKISGSTRDAMKFTESLKVASLAASLRGVGTLVSQPYNMTHTQMSAEEREESGIPETLVWVSVGTGDAEDLVSRFRHAVAVA